MNENVSDELFSDFSLVEPQHVYYWRGSTRIPGVTGIITQTGMSSNYPDIQAMRDARHRGSAVHKAVELHLKGTLDECSLTQDDALAAMNISGYLDAAKRFIDDWIAKIIRFEWIVGHSIFLYGGKLDLLYISRDGRLIVNDWKSGPLPWWVEVQTGAYLEAILSEKKLGLESDELWHGAVQLCPDGSYKSPRISKDRRAFGLFRQALNIVNYTTRKGAGL